MSAERKYRDWDENFKEKYADFYQNEVEERQFSNEHSIGFKGKIFLLVNVYKQIDIVTVIGCKTAGGGVGFTPLYVKLPNSGLIVRFEGELGLNEDGTSNFMGTNPDIEIEKVPGEDYIQRAINETINIIYSMEKIKGK